MDPAFFVGKNVLLAWLNDFFAAGYLKVEQMSNGAMACQIMDAIYPGKVALNKVNFDARTQPESVANFKVLQALFDKEQIPKYVDVSKLLNAKFQDNLEFLQWLKQYFDKNYGQSLHLSSVILLSYVILLSPVILLSSVILLSLSLSLCSLCLLSLLVSLFVEFQERH